MKKRSAPSLPAFRVFRIATLLGLAVTSMSWRSPAAIYTWNGNGTDGNWSTAANWQNGLVPVSNQDSSLIFAGTSQLASNQNIGPFFLLNNLTFNSNAGPFTLSGGRLDFNRSSASVLPTLTQNSASLVTINNALRFNDALTIGGTGNLVLGGNLEASAPVTMAGTGTLTLTGANSFGSLTLQAGIVNAGSAGALGSPNPLVFTGGTLQYSAANQTDYSFRFALTASQAYRIDTNGQNVSYAAGLTSSGGSLAKLGTGTLTLTGANTYTGGTTISLGTLAVGTGGSIGGSSVNVGPGATLALNGTGSVTSGTVDLRLSGTNANPANLTISDSASLIRRRVYVGDTGNVGAVTQTGGTLTTTDRLYLGITGGAGTYTLSGTGSVSTGLALIGYGGVGVFNQNGGTFTTNGSMLFVGDNGDNTGSGTYNLGGGTLTTPRVTTLGGTSAFNFNGGTLRAGASDNPGAATNPTTFFSGLTAASVQAGGAVIDSNGFNVTLAQSLGHDPSLGSTADGGLTKTGAGTLTLTATHAYTGPTTVSAGTLGIVTGGSIGGGTVSVGPGAVLALSGTGSITGSTATLTLDGMSAAPATLLVVDSATINRGKIFVGDTGVGIVNQSSGTVTIPAVIRQDLYLGNSAGGLGTYNLSGTGSLSAGEILVGNNGTGVFNQSGGTVTTSARFYLGCGAPLTSVGTYNLNAGSLSTTLAFVGYGGTGTFNQNGGTFTTSAFSLYVGNNDPLAPAGTGTYNLNGGTLTTKNVTAFGGVSTFNFNGGTIQPNSSTTSFFQGLTTANVRAGGVRIDTQNFNVTVAQSLLHDTALGAPPSDGGLIKVGAGTLTLGGANTYMGNTVVNAGTLVFNGGGTTSRLLQANSGGLIQYDGGTTVGGNLTGPGPQSVLGGGATFSSPTAGVLTIFNGATLNIGGPTDFEEVNNSGTVTVAAGQTLTWNNGQNSLGTLNVSGTANTGGWGSTGVIAINGGGQLTNSSSNLVLGGGSRTTVNAGGTLTAADGTSLELNGALLVNNGVQNGNLNVNYGSQARGTGFFGNVSVGPGGQFGNNSVAGGGSTSALNAIPAAVNFWVALDRAKQLSAAAGSLPLVGPQPSATPQQTNVQNLTLGGASTFNFNLQNTQGPAGVGYDLTNVGNQLTLTGSSAPGNQIVLRLIGLDANGNNGMVASFDPSQGYVFTLVHTTNGIVGYSAGEFTVNTASFVNGTQGGRFSVVQNGNDLVLVFAPVPEPGTWALVALGAGALLLVVRRRQRGW